MKKSSDLNERVKNLQINTIQKELLNFAFNLIFFPVYSNKDLSLHWLFFSITTMILLQEIFVLFAISNLRSLRKREIEIFF